MSIPVNKYPINSATPDAHDSTPVWPTNLMWHIPFVKRSNVTASLSVGVIDWGKLVFCFTISGNNMLSRFSKLSSATRKYIKAGHGGVTFCDNLWDQRGNESDKKMFLP